MWLVVSYLVLTFNFVYGNTPAINTTKPFADDFEQVPVEGQLPCTPDDFADVTLDGETGNLRPSLQIEHGSTGSRFCSVINKFYEGYIVLTCSNGVLTASIAQCVRRGCSTVLAVSVTVGAIAESLSPTRALRSGEKDYIPCSNVNTIYRGNVELSCDGGLLTGDPVDCEAQWSRYRDGEWSARSSQATLRLNDGSLLIIGGLTADGFGYSNEIWHKKADVHQKAYNTSADEVKENADTDPDPSNPMWTRLIDPPWPARHRLAATVMPNGEVMVVGGSGIHGFLNDVWIWREQPYEVLLINPTEVGHTPQGCARYQEPGQGTVSIFESITRCTLKEAPGILGHRYFVSEPQRRSKIVSVDFRWQGDVVDAGVSVRIVLQDMNAPPSPGLCKFVVTFSLTRSFVTDCMGKERDLQTASGAALSFGHNQWYTFKLDFTWDDLLAEAKLALHGHGFDGSFLHHQNETGVSSEYVVSYQGVDNKKPGLKAVQPFVFHNEVGAVGMTRMDLKRVTITTADQWRLVSETAAFSPRAGHQIQSLADSSVILMGGEDENGVNGETWRWLLLSCPDGIMDTTRQLNCQGLQSNYHFGQRCTPDPNGPGRWMKIPSTWTPRFGHQMVRLDDYKIVMMGGFSGCFLNDAHVWEQKEVAEHIYPCSQKFMGEWSSLPGHTSDIDEGDLWKPRYGHSVAYIPGVAGDQKGVMLLLGGLSVEQGCELGSEASYKQDLWCYENGRWVLVSQSAPWSERFYLSVVQSGNATVVVLGGYDRFMRPSAEVWEWIAASGEYFCGSAADPNVNAFGFRRLQSDTKQEL